MRVLLNANLGEALGERLIRANHEVAYAALSLPAAAPDPDVAGLAIRQAMHILTADATFEHEMRRDGLRFPHALVTLRVRGGSACQRRLLGLLQRMLDEHPLWEDGRYYIVEPHIIRVRKL